MGRTSKFSFPYPGRKRTVTETKATIEYPSGINSSKAQKILGTVGDLNIDSPFRDDNGSWRGRRPSTGGMTVAISESTDEDMSHSSSYAHWDGEPGTQLRGKASSTLLGPRFQDDLATDSSSLRRKLHTEHSSSTLRSYYDRQNSPLAVSQQTSASSARDLALRKGFPPVTTLPRSPLLQTDCLDPEESYFENRLAEKSPASTSSKKKPARLDLTRLFPKPRQETGALLGRENLTRSPSTISQDSAESKSSDRNSHRKLTKSDSRSKKLSKLSKSSDRHEQSQSASRHYKKDRLSDINEDRASHLYNEGPAPKSIPNPTKPSTRRRTPPDNHSPASLYTGDLGSPSSPPYHEHVDWQDIRAKVGSPPWETRSFTSASSRHTKGSRHTSASVMSNSDLRNNSVLSISSDEDSDEGTNVSASYSSSHSVLMPVENHIKHKAPQVTPKPHDPPPRVSSKNAIVSTRLPCAQDGNFLTIPLPPLAGSRLSGPWNPEKQSDRRLSTASSQNSAKSTRKPSFKDKPVLAIGGAEFHRTTGRNSRLMAVTKQEEALLEALRQKRARMKETIIAEHEITKSPPRLLTSRQANRDSECSVETIRGAKSNSKERILMYLDTPASYAREIDTSEPSPDLSDFLSFGSDEDDDSTPRTSWIVSKDRARADSLTSPKSESRTSPRTPQSAARLSAVGALGGLVREDRGDGRKGVTFLESVKNPSPDYLHEIDMAWGM